MHMPTLRSITIWLIFGLIAIAAVALGLSGITWAGWQPATCMPDGCFCEAIRAGAVAQPVNTYTNLAFALVGLLIINSTRRGGESPFMQHRAYGYTFGGAVVLIGMGSLFYHASLSFVGQWFDVMGMYLLITFMLLYDVARLRPIGGKYFALIYILANIALGILLVVMPEARRLVFALLVILTLALEVIIWRLRHPNIRYAWLIAAVITFAVAYGIWLLDNSRMLCAPESLLQGHAIWHMLSALAAGMIAIYYSSQRPQNA